MAPSVQAFIDYLTPRHRVIVIGGVAVIGHGFSRHTKDADIWLEPMSSAKVWPTATLAEATSLLARYSEWQVLQAALENPLEEVRALATQHLQEFADAGDPFSLAILEGREIP